MNATDSSTLYWVLGTIVALQLLVLAGVCALWVVACDLAATAQYRDIRQ